VQAARQDWQASQPTLDVSQLVFLDETGASTHMTRAYGRAPKGQRCVAAVPQGHWQTTTFIAGLRVNAITAPLVLDGPIDGQAFLGYVRQCLCPTLQPGDIALADNLPSHKVAGVQQALAARGASLRLLPPYSPDFTPSKTCSPSSRRCSKRPLTAPSMGSGRKSAFCSIPSPQRSAPTTSEQQDIMHD
jgi:hypothetical protein